MILPEIVIEKKYKGVTSPEIEEGMLPGVSSRDLPTTLDKLRLELFGSLNLPSVKRQTAPLGIEPLSVPLTHPPFKIDTFDASIPRKRLDYPIYDSHSQRALPFGETTRGRLDPYRTETTSSAPLAGSPQERSAPLDDLLRHRLRSALRRMTGDPSLQVAKNYDGVGVIEADAGLLRLMVHELGIRGLSTGARYDPNQYLRMMSQEDQKVTGRAALSLMAMNWALDKLGYQGQILPVVEFARDLKVGGRRTQSYYTPAAECNYQRPTLGLNVGDNITRGLPSETIAQLRAKGFSYDQISKVMLATASMQGIYFFVQDMSRGIPHTTLDSVMKMTAEQHNSQWHVRKAAEFAELGVAECVALRDYGLLYDAPYLKIL